MGVFVIAFQKSQQEKWGRGDGGEVDGEEKRGKRGSLKRLGGAES